MTRDETDVRAVCEAFGRAMQAMDFGAMDGLWDRDYEHFLYQPEEFDRPCRNWVDFTSYLNYIPGVVKSVRWQDLEFDVAVLDDAAIVYALVHLGFDLEESRSRWRATCGSPMDCGGPRRVGACSTLTSRGS